MTLGEARKVAAVLETADSGCENCAGALVVKMEEQFPDFEWVTGYADHAEAPYTGDEFIRVFEKPQKWLK
jgi:hypothetical protein